MSNNLKKYSFNDLLKQDRLRIPKIQRDYAQGRKTQKVNEIRKVFVHSLLLVVKGKRPSTELDFIYGSNNMGAFEPLDGQQRLTTLFLLHWMMGVDLRVNDDKKHSMFTYETRNTSDEFCDEIVQHEASQFVEEAQKKESQPSIIIEGRDWFKWEWKYDPTIFSMLVMIDAIFEEMGSEWDKVSTYKANLNNITFNMLNLGDFGLSNELFIKMNSRGKQLSDFDKLKSTLEEELQIQQKETDDKGVSLASVNNEKTWRTLVDGVWIDMFWHKYARKTIEETENLTADDRKAKRLKAAKESELQFKKLLLRLIALQLFENEPLDEPLREAAYSIDEVNIDDLLSVYIDSLTDLRSDEKHTIVPTKKLTLNFPRLIADINLLIYKDNNDRYNEISNILPKTSHIDNDNLSLFDTFLGIKVANDAELIFYALLLFLRAFPAEKYKKDESESVAWYFDSTSHKVWLKNTECWVRTMRNILLNDNNNQRIDRIQYSMEATQSLKTMANDFKIFIDSNSLDLEKGGNVVRQFFASLGTKTYTRIDNQSLLEEIQKAELIINNQDIDWETALNNAENHPYLWGQIRCLLNWSDTDYDKFADYSKRLIQVLNYIEMNELKYYSAILAIAPDCWGESNRLFQYNKDRDNSFKRNMRERNKEGQTYGATLKKIIDKWEESYSALSVEEFFDSLIESKKNDADVWIKCILEYPTILDEAWNKRIFNQNGHIILAQRKTLDSHCFDPVLVYFRELCKEKDMKDAEYKLYDSKGEYAHGFECTKESHKYLVKWSDTKGDYTLQIDDSESKEYSTSDLVDKMKGII